MAVIIPSTLACGHFDQQFFLKRYFWAIFADTLLGEIIFDMAYYAGIRYNYI